jgi:hypothetical protein
LVDCCLPLRCLCFRHCCLPPPLGVHQFPHRPASCLSSTTTGGLRFMFKILLLLK